MPEPTTQKAQLQQIFEVCGATDFSGALASIAGLKETAGTIGDVQANMKLFFDLAGSGDDGAAALATFTAWRDQQAAIFNLFGVENHDALLAAVQNTLADANAKDASVAEATNANEGLKTENAQLTVRIGELEMSQKDFDARVEKEVINRAAAAGITEPVKKPAGGATAASQLSGIDRVQAAISEELAHAQAA